MQRVIRWSAAALLALGVVGGIAAYTGGRAEAQVAGPNAMVLLPNNTNRSGTTAYGPFNVTIPEPGGNVLFYVVSNQFTDPTEQITLLLEESRDGGGIWRPVGGASANGGDTDRFGNPAPRMNTSLTPGPVLLRGTVGVVGEVRFGLNAEPQQ